MEQTNLERMRCASEALKKFSEVSKNEDHLEVLMVDLMTDILHLAHFEGFDAERICENAMKHFRDERSLEKSLVV